MTSHKKNTKNNINCIFCFLTDFHQTELRLLSQMQDERFENILRKYKKLFISGYQNFLKENICEEHQIINENDIISHLKSIDINEIKEFFDEIIDSVYLEWIKGNSDVAIKKLKGLITKNGLYGNKFSTNIANYLFFRGRKIKEKEILNTYDMFHIPFDKRYLIENQRFSLNGIPLLYLGASIEDIKYELDIPENGDEIENFVFSSYYIKEPVLNVIDLRNPFYIFYNESNNNDLSFEFLPKIEYKQIKTRLFFLILSSLCRFEKRVQHRLKSKDSNVFFEEYILPQTLTQAYKSMGEQGILFPSTRIKETLKYKEKKKIKHCNLVLFTKYNDERHYDRELYERLVISNPISINNIKNFSLEKSHCTLIEKEINNLIKESTNFSENEKIKIINNLNEFKNRLTSNITSKNYFPSLFEKIENFLFYNFLVKECFEVLEEK